MTIGHNQPPRAPYPWQQVIWERLVSQWRAAALPHGLLFIAPAGLGYVQLASSWAAFLLCESSRDKPCHQCRSCQAIHEKRHANVFFLDGATVGVQDVRELHADLMLSSHGMRIVIVPHAEALTTASVNALLKCLEDPPDRTLFLMLAMRASALPATLRSRLVRYQAPMATPAQALQFLQPIMAHTDIQQPYLNALLACSGGPLAAWDALEQGVLGHLETLDHLLTACRAGRLTASEATTHRPATLAFEHALLWILWTMTQHIMAYDVKNDGDPEAIINEADQGTRLSWLTGHSMDTLLLRYDAFATLGQRLNNRQLTERLAWEMLFLMIVLSDEEIINHGP